MSVNQVLANRSPYASAPVKQDNNPTAEVVKHEERLSWKKPVYSTALAVAAIGAVYFAYHSGIFSSLFSPPPAPQQTPTPLKPSPSPSSQSTTTQPSSTPPPASTLLGENAIRDWIQILRQEAQDLKKSPEKKTELLALANEVERSRSNLELIWNNAVENFNPNVKQDCPDPKKVCPVPIEFCHTVIRYNEKHETWLCTPINSYIQKLLKEGCPYIQQFPLDDFGNTTSCVPENL